MTQSSPHYFVVGQLIARDAPDGPIKNTKPVAHTVADWEAVIEFLSDPPLPGIKAGVPAGMLHQTYQAFEAGAEYVQLATPYVAVAVLRNRSGKTATFFDTSALLPAHQKRSGDVGA